MWLKAVVNLFEIEFVAFEDFFNEGKVKLDIRAAMGARRHD